MSPAFPIKGGVLIGQWPAVAWWIRPGVYFLLLSSFFADASDCLDASAARSISISEELCDRLSKSLAGVNQSEVKG